jgi:hypothetical protein
MKQLIAIAALSFVVVFSGFAQSNDLKGPKYKNAKISEKYDGNSSILINENPNQFKGPERKNFKPNDYQVEIIDMQEIQLPNIDIVASTDSKMYTSEDENEKIIYRRVETKDMESKNTKGLKGPAYKNYKP